jgi:hypothetical protein
MDEKLYEEIEEIAIKTKDSNTKIKLNLILMKYLCDKITNDMEKVDTVIKSIN